jgi:hypothetical protein
MYNLIAKILPSGARCLIRLREASQAVQREFKGTTRGSSYERQCRARVGPLQYHSISGMDRRSMVMSSFVHN